MIGQQKLVPTETWKSHAFKLMANYGLTALNFDVKSTQKKAETREILSLLLMLWQMKEEGQDRKEVLTCVLNTVSSCAEWVLLTFPLHLQQPLDRVEEQWELIMEYMEAEYIFTSPDMM